MIFPFLAEAATQAISMADKVSIVSSTAIAVGIILAAAGLGSALGWGMICSKYIEGIARQPEMQPKLMGQMLFTGGLMEAFPMIVLGMAMWFIFANPFIGALG